MKNPSAKKPKKKQFSSGENSDQLNNHGALINSTEENNVAETIQKKYKKYPPEKLNNQKSKELAENSSPVCFAQSDEVRDEYQS